MSPLYLDSAWRYHTAASHANAGPFARRQQQRRREAQEVAKPAPSNVKPINRRKSA